MKINDTAKKCIIFLLGILLFLMVFYMTLKMNPEPAAQRLVQRINCELIK